jgi:hypothetical protein
VKAKEQNKNKIPAKSTAGSDTKQVLQANALAKKVERNRSLPGKPTEVNYQADPLPVIEPVPQADGSPTSKTDDSNERTKHSIAVKHSSQS